MLPRPLTSLSPSLPCPGTRLSPALGAVSAPSRPSVCGSATTVTVAADVGFVTYLVDEEAGGGGTGTFSRDLAARQSSMSSGVVEDKKAKRRSGLLKGLGGMFR